MVKMPAASTFCPGGCRGGSSVKVAWIVVDTRLPKLPKMLPHPDGRRHQHEQAQVLLEVPVIDQKAPAARLVVELSDSATIAGVEASAERRRASSRGRRMNAV